MTLSAILKIGDNTTKNYDQIYNVVSCQYKISCGYNYRLPDTEAKNNEYISKGQTNIRYFVPLKKNGVDLSWSKAVTIYARCYATTQQECIALYNRLIQDSIEWHEQEIKKLEKDLL